MMNEKFNSDDYLQGERNKEHGPDKNRKGYFLYNLANLAGKTAVGLGVGITVGVGVLAAVAAAEVTIPAVLVFNALGLTGGALGFLHGTRNLK
jgi:hypothetical protein